MRFWWRSTDIDLGNVDIEGLGFGRASGNIPDDVSSMSDSSSDASSSDEDDDEAEVLTSSAQEPIGIKVLHDAPHANVE